MCAYAHLCECVCTYGINMYVGLKIKMCGMKKKIQTNRLVGLEGEEDNWTEMWRAEGPLAKFV